MTVWPSKWALENALAWNEVELDRQDTIALNARTPERVDEAVRCANRLANNIAQLKERIAA